MTRPPKIKNPAYLELMRYILVKKHFSSTDIINKFYTKEAKDNKNRKLNRQRKLFNDKIKALEEMGFIEFLKLVNSKETKGKGRYSIYRINSPGIFNYFYSNYFSKNLKDDLTNSEKLQLSIIFGKNFEDLLNKETYNKIKETHKVKFNNLDELFGIIYQNISSQLISFGLKYAKKIIL